MIRDKILSLLLDALKKSGVDAKEVILQHPADPEHGDYSTNVALVSAKKLKKQPVALAEEIKDALPQDDLIAKVTVEKPGFINFFLSDKALLKELQRVNSETHGKKKAGKTILLEYGQPNTHKVPHIGHLFSYIFAKFLVV